MCSSGHKWATSWGASAVPTRPLESEWAGPAEAPPPGSSQSHWAPRGLKSYSPGKPATQGLRTIPLLLGGKAGPTRWPYGPQALPAAPSRQPVRGPGAGVLRTAVAWGPSPRSSRSQASPRGPHSPGLSWSDKAERDGGAPGQGSPAGQARPEGCRGRP